MNELKDLLARNEAWSRKVREEDPDFFTRLEGQQNPEYFWIGCADSRVPANEIIIPTIVMLTLTLGANTLGAAPGVMLELGDDAQIGAQFG